MHILNPANRALWFSQGKFLAFPPHFNIKTWIMVERKEFWQARMWAQFVLMMLQVLRLSHEYEDTTGRLHVSSQLQKMMQTLQNLERQANFTLVSVLSPNYSRLSTFKDFMLSTICNCISSTQSQLQWQKLLSEDLKPRVSQETSWLYTIIILVITLQFE